MKFFFTVTAILVSGLCWYFASDLSGSYGYLQWIAPIPVLIVSFQSLPQKAFLTSFMAYLVGRLNWLPYLLTVLPVPLGIFFTVILPVIFAVVILLVRKIVLKHKNALSTLAFPVLWSLFEFLLFKFSPDGTAGSIAYTQANILPVIQVASFTGILGITFLLTLFPSIVAVWVYYRDRKMIMTLSILLSVIFISLLFGIIRINSKQPNQNEITAGLAVIDEKYHSETNRPDDQKELATANLYAVEIARVAQSGAQVAVLPEKIVNVSPATITGIKNIFVTAAINNHIAVVIGYTQFIAPNQKQNKALAISSTGHLLADYQKVNLFEGEARNGFEPGKEISFFRFNQINSGVTICKDMDYAGFVRKYDKSNIEVLFVPAWDFVKDGWLHSRMAILRGVENGCAVVRTARQGVLTISDDHGKVLYEAASINNKAVSLTGRFSLHSRKTVYGRFGDWFGFANLLAALYFIFLAVNNKKK